MRTNLVLVTVAVAFILAGCGPNDPSGPAEFALGPYLEPLPLRVGFQSLIARNRAHSLNVRGACTGIAKLVVDPTTPAVFEGVAGFLAVESITFDTPSCTALNIGGATTRYYDANYAPIGESFPGQAYARFQVMGAPLPLIVRLGDNATYATFDLYVDGSKAIVAGTRVLSYLIEQDTVKTVFIGFLTKDYNNAGQLKKTRIDRYRLYGNGELQLRSIEFQENTTGFSVQLLN